MYTVEEIGDGDTARVFHVTTDSRDYAVKSPREHTNHPLTRKFYPQQWDHEVYAAQVAELHRESYVMSVLGNSPSLPEYMGRRGDSIQMEYMESGNLEEYICSAREDLKNSPQEEWREYASYMWFVFKEVTTNMIDLYERGLHSHVDLRPANILLDALGRPVISDVGGSILTDKSKETMLRPEVQPAYHPCYASPELLREGKISRKSDVYSIGMSMLDAFGIRLEFGEDYEEVEKTYRECPDPRDISLMPSVSGFKTIDADGILDTIFIRTTRSNPAHRWSIYQLRDVFKHCYL